MQQHTAHTCMLSYVYTSAYSLATVYTYVAIKLITFMTFFLHRLSSIVELDLFVVRLQSLVLIMPTKCCMHMYMYVAMRIFLKQQSNSNKNFSDSFSHFVYKQFVACMCVHVVVGWYSCYRLYVYLEFLPHISMHMHACSYV